jgi:hypothetical protein
MFFKNIWPWMKVFLHALLFPSTLLYWLFDWIFEDPLPPPRLRRRLHYQTGVGRNYHLWKRIARRPYMRMKANIEYLQRLKDLPDEYPEKPVDILKFIKIDVDPLAQFHQMEQYHHVFNKDEDQDDPPPRPETVLENYKLEEHQPIEDIDEDTPPPLISRHDGYCSSSDDEDSSDDDDDTTSTNEDNVKVPRTKHWTDLLRRHASATRNNDAQACAYRHHPPRQGFARKKSTKTCHAFLEAAKLSRNRHPLHSTDPMNQDFTPTKLTIYNSSDVNELPIIIDSGDSITITPILADFVGSVKPSTITSLQGISARTNVEGEGTVCWTIPDALSQVHQLKTKAYYVPGAKICLFSPQQYFEEITNNPFVTFNKYGAELGLNDGSILSFPFQK